MQYKNQLQVILRVTAFYDETVSEKEESMDHVLKINTELIYLGYPQPCHRFNGNNSWKINLCNGLNQIVNSEGKIYLYEVEVRQLCDIYKEVSNHDILIEVVKYDKELALFEEYDAKQMFQRFQNDLILWDFVKKSTILLQLFGNQRKNMQMRLIMFAIKLNTKASKMMRFTSSLSFHIAMHKKE